MKPLWSPVVANAGSRSQIRMGQERPKQAKPLPWVATACRLERMVRRGSTVRVRQRALQKPRKPGLLLSGPLARSTACGGYGALYGAFRSRDVSVRGENRTLRHKRRPGFDAERPRIETRM